MYLSKPFPSGRTRVPARQLTTLESWRGATKSAAHDDLIGGELTQFWLQQQTIFRLEDELEAAKRSSERARYASPTRVVRNHDEILRMTSQLFPEVTISLAVETDPEIDDDDYFVVSVTARGAFDDLAVAHRDWHRRLLELAPETATYYRLSLGIQ